MTEREDEAHRSTVSRVRTIATFVRVHVELGVGLLQQEQHTLKSKNRGTCNRDSSTRSNHGVYIGSKVGIGEYGAVVGYFRGTYWKLPWCS